MRWSPGAGFDGLERNAMNPKSIEQARDPDLRNSLVALKRAAKRARETALRTKTRVVIARDGKWVRVSPAKLAQ
ncbi:MAG: hypothetical protein L0312_10155 [Acidobacteria bacterium]|nr:hypothetical protein [Acidobacteriota bacterium]